MRMGNPPRKIVLQNGWDESHTLGLVRLDGDLAWERQRFPLASQLEPWARQAPTRQRNAIDSNALTVSHQAFALPHEHPRILGDLHLVLHRPRPAPTGPNHPPLKVAGLVKPEPPRGLGLNHSDLRGQGQVEPLCEALLGVLPRFHL